MRFASLGSGSRGNATLVEHKDTCLMVDCGFTLKETEQRLARLGKTGWELTAVLVTHEHSDHVRGVGALARKYDLPVYLTAGTCQQSSLGQIKQLIQISSHQHFSINDLRVQPIPVPHDAREPCQFVFDEGTKKLGVLTDLGSVTPFIRQCYGQLDGLLLECNHDPDMLAQGPYPYPVKKRIASAFGHLSNEQAADLLAAVDLSCLQHLVISHMSEQNNSEEKAITALARVTGCDGQGLTVADQSRGFDWRLIL